MPHRFIFAILPLVAVLLAVDPILAETPPPSAAAQPTLPQDSGLKPASPVVEQIVGQKQPVLVVHRQVRRAATERRRHLARRWHSPRDLDRPALAGVELLAPLPPPGEPPHIVVPLPAYGLDSIVTDFTTPPPPIVCHRVRREPDAPDPRLYREVPVACVPDNP